MRQQYGLLQIHGSFPLLVAPVILIGTSQGCFWKNSRTTPVEMEYRMSISGSVPGIGSFSVRVQRHHFRLQQFAIEGEKREQETVSLEYTWERGILLTEGSRMLVDIPTGTYLWLGIILSGGKSAEALQVEGILDGNLRFRVLVEDPIRIRVPVQSGGGVQLPTVRGTQPLLEVVPGGDYILEIFVDLPRWIQTVPYSEWIQADRQVIGTDTLIVVNRSRNPDLYWRLLTTLPEHFSARLRTQS